MIFGLVRTPFSRYSFFLSLCLLIKSISFAQKNPDHLFNGFREELAIPASENRDQLTSLFLKSFEPYYEKPMILLAEKGEILQRVEFYRYPDLHLNHHKLPVYAVSFLYENDKPYRALFLVNQALSESLILFESFTNETKYERTSRLKKDKLCGAISLIEYCGTTGEEITAIDTVSSKRCYLINADYFREYLKKENGKVVRHFGPGGRETGSSPKSTCFEEGRVEDHLKTGHWIERRYVAEYDAPVIMEGEYRNGLRHGKWSYSPNGPAEKVEVYEMGVLKEVWYP